MAKAILIRQTKSKAQVSASQKKTLNAVGLRGIGSGIFRRDTHALRGMLNKVQHLIEATQVDISKSKRPEKTKGKFKGYQLG
jgi:large subunit ribosomal protein L30